MVACSFLTQKHQKVTKKKIVSRKLLIKQLDKLNHFHIWAKKITPNKLPILTKISIIIV